MEERYNDIEKLVKEAGLEHPSSDFLNNVMNQVETSTIEESIVYKPLISKKAWIVIASIVFSCLSLLLFMSGEGESMFDKINLTPIAFEGFKSPLSGLTLDKTTSYGIIFLILLFFVQVTMLKRRIDKTFSL
ncbi:hypothetical protein [Aquimarina sp. MMG016]|uniref:hypothetical protein n=1 Tax=Aquimarina sp. MMG016 TaxID=2822690 RepID=UPI001B3A319D|nr:hypothetical protein [Aquimarina sp. MMG016]MBQ4820334.1 hypothetical protein [Aquimarina sp. MMG016]